MWTVNQLIDELLQSKQRGTVSSEATIILRDNNYDIEYNISNICDSTSINNLVIDLSPLLPPEGYHESWD